MRTFWMTAALVVGERLMQAVHGKNNLNTGSLDGGIGNSQNNMDNNASCRRNQQTRGLTLRTAKAMGLFGGTL